MTNGNNEVIKKIRDVIEKGGNIDINTRDVLLFSAIIDIYDQIEKFAPVLTFYRVGMWFAALFGTSFVGLVFGLLTGQVQIVFK